MFFHFLQWTPDNLLMLADAIPEDEKEVNRT